MARPAAEVMFGSAFVLTAKEARCGHSMAVCKPVASDLLLTSSRLSYHLHVVSEGEFHAA